MTVLDRLISTGAQEQDAKRAVAAIGAALPFGYDVRITDEVLDAARSGDLALVAMLLSEEVEPDEEDLAIIDSLPVDTGVRISREQVVAQLGLSLSDKHPVDS
jgi:hypothetical protein